MYGSVIEGGGRGVGKEPTKLRIGSPDVEEQYQLISERSTVHRWVVSTDSHRDIVLEKLVYRVLSQILDKAGPMIRSQAGLNADLGLAQCIEKTWIVNRAEPVANTARPTLFDCPTNVGRPSGLSCVNRTRQSMLISYPPEIPSGMLPNWLVLVAGQVNTNNVGALSYQAEMSNQRIAILWR